MWRTISYVSTVNPKLTNLEVKELFNFVRVKNNKLKITGILLYSDGNFFQVLEGENELVTDLYNSMRIDSRHYDVITIFNHTMGEFSFS